MIKRSISIRTRALIALAAPMICATLAQAGNIQVIHSTIAGQPTSLVPGEGGALRFTRFDFPWRSPDGNRWILLCGTNRGAIENDLILKGMGTAGAVAIKEGTIPAPWQPAETINTLDFGIGLNNDGSFAFSANTSLGPDVGDEYVVKFNGSTYEIIAREGDPIPSIPGATYGLILDDVHLLADGRVGFTCINANNLPTESNTCLFLGDQLFAREGVTIPSGQIFGGMWPWDNFDFLTYFHSSDGSKSIVSGDTENTNTSMDGVLVVNGIVFMQENASVIPTFALPVVSGLSGFVEVAMMSNGDWFARGSNSDGQDWVVRNNIALARTNAAIFSGAAENWSDAVPNVRTYFLHVGNNHGDYAIGGWTNNADANRNTVIALNNQRVIAREGDMVDLNNNGVSDDDAFIAAMGLDEGFLNDRRELYFTATLRNAAGTSLGEAFLRTKVCAADTNGDGQVNVNDLLNVINAWGPAPQGTAADLAPPIGDGQVNVGDLLSVINAWGSCS